MSLIPPEELKRQGSINLAPLVDFLFLVIAVFATLAVTHTALYDNEVSLVTLNQSASPATGQQDVMLINLSITEKGEYKWISEINEYLMDGPPAIQQELLRQQELGLLPKDKSHTKVLLHIDKNAPWDPIAQAIFAVREIGFAIHPVYEPMETAPRQPKTHPSAVSLPTLEVSAQSSKSLTKTANSE